jgi:lipoprotein-releasing system permease protein
MSFEIFIGGRYLRAKQKQAFISLINILAVAGVTLGVMALIVVIAVMTGATADMKSRILGVESHIVLMRHGKGFDNHEEVIGQVKSISGITGVAPFVYSQIMLRSAGGVSGAVVRGIDPQRAVQKIKDFDNARFAEALPHNPQTPSNHRPGIVLGIELARNLGVVVGDPLYLISPQGMLSPMGHMPAMRRFQVTGVFDTGMYDYDGSVAYVHLADAQRLMRMENDVSGLEIRVDDIYQADTIREQLIGALGYPFWARDWMQLNRNLFSALKLEKAALSIILTLIVLVAAFNITSSLIMMVMEKTRDIAILKAMGATDRSIRRIFVIKGMTIGALGTTIGVVLGLILCALLRRYKFIELPDVYYFSTLPVQLEWGDVLAVAAAAMGICFLATLYPARQAARLNPVEAIRYG